MIKQKRRQAIHRSRERKMAYLLLSMRLPPFRHWRAGMNGRHKARLAAKCLMRHYWERESLKEDADD